MKLPSEHLCPRPPSQCCSAVPSPHCLQWRIIVGATKCIPKSELPEEVEVTTLASTRLWTHPSDLTIALSASTPLYPPGRIIHVVHNHPAEQCWYVLPATLVSCGAAVARAGVAPSRGEPAFT